MEFIDSHAHLNDPAFDADREDILARLPQADVTLSVEIGCAPEEWQPALELAAKHPAFVRAVLGMHPEYASQLTQTGVSELEHLLADKNNVAVGEIGLDYTCLDIAGKDLQQDVFTQMLGLANKTNLPVVLHVRREGEDYAAYEDTFAALKRDWTPVSNSKHAGVLHCFCARYEEAKRALDNGLLLGINGCFTYKKNEYIREAVKKAGADKIIFETDCPYLSPQGKRGTRNNPANIPLIARFTADYLNVPLEDLAQITTQNARELYGLE